MQVCLPRHHSSGARPLVWLLALVITLGTAPISTVAHPHVFVDGGVDFIFDDTGASLQTVSVTWRYDAFETLFMLSNMGVSPEPGQDFSPDDRRRAEAMLSEFAPDFDGSAHLTVAGVPVALEWPRDLSARMVGDRLEVSFLRDLAAPLASAGPLRIDVGFYERTYYFAFSLTDAPTFENAQDRCSITIALFEDTEQTAEMRAALARLSREEEPENSTAGAVFADRMVVQCG